MPRRDDVAPCTGMLCVVGPCLGALCRGMAHPLRTYGSMTTEGGDIEGVSQHPPSTSLADPRRMPFSYIADPAARTSSPTSQPRLLTNPCMAPRHHCDAVQGLAVAAMIPLSPLHLLLLTQGWLTASLPPASPPASLLPVRARGPCRSPAPHLSYRG